MAILLPSRVAHRKVRKGKNDGVATRCNTVAFGEFGLMSLDNERINSRQIEAARQAITRYIKRGGKIWIRIFPHTPSTTPSTRHSLLRTLFLTIGMGR